MAGVPDAVKVFGWVKLWELAIVIGVMVAVLKPVKLPSDTANQLHACW